MVQTRPKVLSKFWKEEDGSEIEWIFSKPWNETTLVLSNAPLLLHDLGVHFHVFSFRDHPTAINLVQIMAKLVSMFHFTISQLNLKEPQTYSSDESCWSFCVIANLLVSKMSIIVFVKLIKCLCFATLMGEISAFST